MDDIPSYDAKVILGATWLKYSEETSSLTYPNSKFTAIQGVPLRPPLTISGVMGPGPYKWPKING